jgi:hypothetical protein
MSTIMAVNSFKVHYYERYVSLGDMAKRPRSSVSNLKVVRFKIVGGVGEAQAIISLVSRLFGVRGSFSVPVTSGM